MFVLHSSNRTENLIQHLKALIENLPLDSVLETETFLIQSQGMERWLSQQLASHFSVWGNYQFLFPGKFFSMLAEKIEPGFQQSTFARESLQWQIFSLLNKDCNAPFYQEINGFLNHDPVGLKRFQLARQLAQIFDQYQIMRPDMLDLWRQKKLLYGHKEEEWQAHIWRVLLELNSGPHRGAVWEALIDRLNGAKEGHYKEQLPERLFIFGLNTIAPIFLHLLQALSRHCQVHFFLLNPCQLYWADWFKKREVGSPENGMHPLLVSLGAQGREFQQMLLEQCQFDYQPVSFESSVVTNNLQQCQNDVLNNLTGGKRLTTDDSIKIHACHSRYREVDVIKNEILNCLQQQSELELRDIVVMAPDIQPYIPYINGLFKNIPHSVADRTLSQSNAFLNTLIDFLRLSQSRFGWHSVMELFEIPYVHEHFSISTPDLDLINFWVKDAQVRWGKSEDHCKALALPELNQNTWQAALNRWFMGYAVNSDEFVETILPYKQIEGMSAHLLGGFNDYLQLLFSASDDLQNEATLDQWSEKLLFYAGQLLEAKSHENQLKLQNLNEILLQLNAVEQSTSAELMSLEVILDWLENKKLECYSSQGFLRGYLTFCSMLPMRSIPFKIIVLMGMNEGDFPKVDRYPDFDLMGNHFRHGDRSRRSDDRYQFLELLLSAREKLIISYQGFSLNNQTEIPPSPILSEFLQVMKEFYQLSEWVVQHRLHGFDRVYFSDNRQMLNYSATDYDIACAMQAKDHKPVIWWQGYKAEDVTPVLVNTEDLINFFQHPQRFFLQKQLGLKLQDIVEFVDEHEPFKLHLLERYKIDQQIFIAGMAEQNISLAELQAQGLYIPAAMGEIQFYNRQTLIQEFVQRIDVKQLAEKCEPELIDSELSGFKIKGVIDGGYAQGGLVCRYAKFKGKDFLGSLVYHLLLNRNRQVPTYVYSEDSKLIFLPDENADQLLLELLKFYQQGLHDPFAFFSQVSLAFMNKNSSFEKINQEIFNLTAYDLYLQLLMKQLTVEQLQLSDSFYSFGENWLKPLGQKALHRK